MSQELTILLSRIQFALALSYHIIFPTINIGLSILITAFEWRWLKTGEKKYYNLTRTFTKIFALAFGVGVVSGITLSFMFGTNFAQFSLATGNIIGPLLSYEVLTAFFLEATFLGIMLFGWNRVSTRMHFASTLTVTIGTFISAFWILSANSWMHTPQGFTTDENGIMHIESWLKVIFNPSFPYRYMHMITAAIISGSLIVAAIGAFNKLKGNKDEANIALKFSLIVIAIFAPSQVILGDIHGLNTVKHQPYKVSAMEGRWDTMKGAPLILFGIPDQKNETIKMEFGIPKVTSLILTHDFDGEVKGLKDLPKDKRPYMPTVFYAFRIMVGLGLIFVLVGIYGCYKHVFRKQELPEWFLKTLKFLAPAGIVATICGWIVTECGRQPWIVYNHMLVKDGATVMNPSKVMFSLTLIGVVDTLIFISFLFYLLHYIKKGFVDYPLPTYNSKIEKENIHRTAWLDESED